MRRVCFILWVGLLLVGLSVSLPGLAEVVESAVPGSDCSDACPRDSAEGKCSSSCDECTCCARAMSALMMPCAGLSSPRRVEARTPVVPVPHPFVFARGVFHPPRV